KHEAGNEDDAAERRCRHCPLVDRDLEDLEGCVSDRRVGQDEEEIHQGFSTGWDGAGLLSAAARRSRAVIRSSSCTSAMPGWATASLFSANPQPRSGL